MENDNNNDMQNPTPEVPQTPPPVAPAAPVAPAVPVTPVTTAPTGGNPGKTLGIIGLVLSFLPFMGLIALILSIVGLNKSKKAGMSNGVAVAGIVLGSLNLIGALVFMVFMFIGFGALAQMCSELGPGTHLIDGITYTCS